MTHARGWGRGEEREGRGSANGRRRRAMAGVLALAGVAALAGAPGLHAGTLPRAPRMAPRPTPARVGAAQLIEREVAARLGGTRRGERAPRPAVRDSLEASEP